MHIRIYLLLATAALLTFPSAAYADESYWIYTKGAETLPKGETEAKLAVVSRRGKADSDYVFNDIRLEIEHGLTDRLTVYGELVVYNHNYSTTNPDLQPLFDTQGGAGGRFKKTQISGIDVGVKYNILSPYKDPIGLAVSLGWDHRFKYRIDGSKINQDEAELTIHFQKNFLNNQLVFAFSPKIEYEHRLSPGIIEKEFSLDLAAGVSYRVAPKWNIGGEFRHQSDYLSPYDTVAKEYDPNLRPSKFPFKFGSQYQNGNYLGPVVHYANQKYWATAGALWQISGGGKFAFNRNGRNVDEHEKVHIGLTFGLEL
jgi:opacity protein-like surface antigen